MAGPLIFDLDGTLIDSAPGILGSFDRAFKECGLRPKIPLDESVIGPPLDKTLRDLSGSEDLDTLSHLADAFKEHYDAEGYKCTLPFPGVEEMLKANRTNRMFIVTNKREKPTRLILTFLNWVHFFEKVYAINTFGLAVKDKSELLGKLLTDARLDPSECVYVGDRPEDFEAATTNKTDFLWALWGGSKERCHPQISYGIPIESPSALIERWESESMLSDNYGLP